MAARNVNRKAQGVCVTCGTRKALVPHCQCGKCRKKGMERSTVNMRRYKPMVLAHYGLTCFCCGEAEQAFLSIDHIGGGGTQHRKSLKRYGSSFHQWIVKQGYPKGFRTLCMNCQFGYKHCGVCPHQTRN